MRRGWWARHRVRLASGLTLCAAWGIFLAFTDWTPTADFAYGVIWLFVAEELGRILRAIGHAWLGEHDGDELPAASTVYRPRRRFRS